MQRLRGGQEHGECEKLRRLAWLEWGIEVEVSGEVGRARPWMKEFCLCSKYSGK